MGQSGGARLVGCESVVKGRTQSHANEIQHYADRKCFLSRRASQQTCTAQVSVISSVDKASLAQLIRKSPQKPYLPHFLVNANSTVLPNQMERSALLFPPYLGLYTRLCCPGH